MMNKQALVISNDSSFYERLFVPLQAQGITVTFASSGADALERFIQGSYCLAVLDLELKNENSFYLLRLMKQAKSIPILTLSSKQDTASLVNIFRTGADANLDKTVDVSVCAAQALSLIRLYTEAKYLETSLVPLAFGSDFLILPESHQALIKGVSIELTRLEFDVLFLLATNRNRVLSSEEIYRQVWGIHNGPPAKDAVKSVIKNLRRKLQLIPRILIRNVRGIGYPRHTKKPQIPSNCHLTVK